SIMWSSRAAADLSFRAPPVLDRSRRDNARGPIPLRWLNRSALALGHAGYPVRKHLQLATFWVSRRPPHLRHAGAAHDGGAERPARGGTPTLCVRRSRDRQSAIPRGNGPAAERRTHRANDPHAARRFDGGVSRRQHRDKWRRHVANAYV